MLCIPTDVGVRKRILGSFSVCATTCGVRKRILGGRTNNYQQFYMDLNLANTESEITWQLLYDFKKSYGVPDLSVKSVMSVLNGVIASDESLHTFLQR